MIQLVYLRPVLKPPFFSNLPNLAFKKKKRTSRDKTTDKKKII